MGIELEGVRVHNLKNVSLGIRRDALTVICGVSGSGKSSLAFDTLNAEGQRRYIETFSPYARQFLDRIERPDADRIEGIPPSIAIRQNGSSHGVRSTVGTRTEILEYLRLLFVRAGELICPDCLIPIARFTAESVADWLLRYHQGRKVMLAFRCRQDSIDHPLSAGELTGQLLHRGFTRAVVDSVVVRLDQLADDFRLPAELTVIVDRVRPDQQHANRLRDSLETAFAAGDNECVVLCEQTAERTPASDQAAERYSAADFESGGQLITIDGQEWQSYFFSSALRCVSCQQEFAEPVPELLNFNSVIGACPTCEGTGSVSTMLLDKVVPDQSLSIRQDAIQVWSTPAWRHEQEELLALAADYGIPVDLPVSKLSAEQRRIIEEGVPERSFGGLAGFHRWLIRHRYKRGVRVFLNRWRSWVSCPDCRGTRLNPAAGALRVDGRRFFDLAEMELTDLAEWVAQQQAILSEATQLALRSVTEHLQHRLQFLLDCGLGYLSLNRPLRTLSGGEAQRVLLTAAMGSGLVNTMYVLDEPTSGLHSQDTQRVIRAAQNLKAVGNTIVVVEHDPDFILAADEVIEIGPDAGANGGQLVFQGTPQELLQFQNSVTGRKLREHLGESHIESSDSEPPDSESPDCRPQGSMSPALLSHGRRNRRPVEHWLQVSGVNCHNLVDLDVRLPLGVIGAVTGVSGSGKSSLIVDSVYPAICRAKGQTCGVNECGMVRGITGMDAFDQVLLLDQSPLQKTSRSIPATWIGVFDDIRKLLSETHEAKKRNCTPASFSFNSVRGGRCPICEGLGYVTVEMQFLADIQTVCEACSGRRFRTDILEVRYRDRSVHDILEMTSDEAFIFFSGHHRIQQRLNAVRQAGLGYLRLGQPLSTLSGGEAQRLRIASLLAGVPFSDGEDSAVNRSVAKMARSDRTLFLLDEPSTGLHLQDIDHLIGCLDFLVQTGHSVLVIEHDEYLLARTDYRIELGPGAGSQGGRIIHEG